MRTDQLIQAMAADTQRTRPVEAVLPVALLTAVAVAALVFFWMFGVRADIGPALTHLTVILKQVLPWLLAAAGFGMVLSLGRPGAEVGRWTLVLLLAVPVVAAMTMASELTRLPVEDWVAAARGRNLIACLTSIPLLSIPIVAGSLWALQRGASTRPGLTGAMIGLMSAGAAAGIYAFHCNDDSPLFYGLWYALAILGVTLVTALVGRRVLRW